MPTPPALKIYLLDVGTEKYGDCIVCEVGNQRILIDGAHPGDYKRRGEWPSIPDQFEELFGHQSPFHFDLLVVTHCHSDHIGCLPTLIAQGTITTKWALVADETLGFGRQDDRTDDSVSPLANQLAAALREEDYSHLPDDELMRALQDIATLESRYGQMLTTLAEQDTKIIRYGKDNHRALETAFRSFGLKILGPTRAHLDLCAGAIARVSDRATADIERTTDTDLISLYRTVVDEADSAGAEDRPGKGAALNNQSIVLKLGVGAATALLAGDMQFAKPEVTGLATPMKALRATVKAAGPYSFIKLTHHSSYNGFDETLLREWSPTVSYAHTGGLNDASHPDPGVLQVLDAHREELEWARTDHNGLITVTFPQGSPVLEVTKGELNDAAPNGDIEEAIAGPSGEKPTPLVHTYRKETGRAVILNATATVPPDVTRVTVTFDITRRADTTPDIPPTAGRRAIPPRRGQTPPSVSSPPLRLAGGRALPKLLFITYRPRLANNLGVNEAEAAIALIRDAGNILYEVVQPANPWPEVRAQLTRGQYEGIVILGGYDVLPAQRLDVLPPSLRAQAGTLAGDADNFIVWNDEAYGDVDGDLLPEIPVSRIPDAKTPRLVRSALTAGVSAGIGSRYGVRNDARPFAGPVYAALPGQTPLYVSQPSGPASLGSRSVNGDAIYFMLHGSDSDGTRFWGEDQMGTLEAVNLSNLPQTLSGVVFAGCCWGALTVDPPASASPPGQPLGIRTPGQSIALSCLHAGAIAFVGCTGTHYSPTVAPYRYFGGPLHEAFFAQLLQGKGPAEALFLARKIYAGAIPHGQTSNVGKAIEFKIWRQFTCLGIGW